MVTLLPERPTALGSAPTLKTIDDVDAALHELSWLGHATVAVEARLKMELDEAKRRNEFNVSIDGTPLSPKQRSAELKRAIAAWADEHLRAYLPMGVKTLDLPHGALSLKKQTLSVACREGLEDSDVLKAVEAKVGLVERIVAWLAKVKLGSFLLGQVITLKPQLNKTAIKAAWAANPGGRRTLTALGLEVHGGDDALHIEPSQYHLARPAA